MQGIWCEFPHNTVTMPWPVHFFRATCITHGQQLWPTLHRFKRPLSPGLLFYAALMTLMRLQRHWTVLDRQDLWQLLSRDAGGGSVKVNAFCLFIRNNYDDTVQYFSCALSPHCWTIPSFQTVLYRSSSLNPPRWAQRPYSTKTNPTFLKSYRKSSTEV